jgi:hypothetical protein
MLWFGTMLPARGLPVFNTKVKALLNAPGAKTPGNRSLLGE